MTPFKSYTDVLNYMYTQLPMFQRQGASAYIKDLTNTIALCKLAGNPQDLVKTIHIAGTNGKGTTSHIVAAGLQAQGYKVGVYTSPHYKDFRERIKINGKYISRHFILNFINKYKSALEEIKPSFFEMTVALAFSYFENQKVDYAVIETGLGGRLDSTNVIQPMVSVITNISYDHQNLLGNSLEEIALEKAGIIKAGVPVIIGERQENIQNIFLEKAKVQNSPIMFAQDHITLTELHSTGNGSKKYSVYVDGSLWIDELTTDLSGPYQEKNLISGLFVLHHLSRKINISAEKIKLFFPTLKEKTKYIGRWEILQHHPLIIADSAHNEGGLKLVFGAIKKMSFRRLHIVIGFVNDKDLSKILHLFPSDASYYFTKANIPRGLPAKDLRTMANSYGLKGKAYVSVRKALAAAKTKATKDDLIYVGGSIFIVAEVL
ncbi:MAG: bifunctional folylpolyglutamate synthase/dihydrofolate synthase [Saprospiraceae bacterium]|nr:bifunctional folylpolyglutamate synthase/dihydrofolate synthase [Saprospiraceae bacterium]